MLPVMLTTDNRGRPFRRGFRFPPRDARPRGCSPGSRSIQLTIIHLMRSVHSTEIQDFYITKSPRQRKLRKEVFV
jgi:hypothetical protein